MTTKKVAKTSWDTTTAPTGKLKGPPPPFFYDGLEGPPETNKTVKGVPAPKGYPMSPNNLTPALVLWLFLTTNPAWPAILKKGGAIPDYYKVAPASIEEIAERLGLTPGTVKAIIKLVTTGENAKEVIAAFKLVGKTFQRIKAQAASKGLYKPPCPPNASSILALAPSAWVTDPGAPITDSSTKTTVKKPGGSW